MAEKLLEDMSTFYDPPIDGDSDSKSNIYFRHCLRWA